MEHVLYVHNCNYRQYCVTVVLTTWFLQHNFYEQKHISSGSAPHIPRPQPHCKNLVAHLHIPQNLNQNDPFPAEFWVAHVANARRTDEFHTPTSTKSRPRVVSTLYPIECVPEALTPWVKGPKVTMITEFRHRSLPPRPVYASKTRFLSTEANQFGFVSIYSNCESNSKYLARCHHRNSFCLISIPPHVIFGLKESIKKCTSSYNKTN